MTKRPREELEAELGVAHLYLVQANHRSVHLHREIAALKKELKVAQSGRSTTPPPRKPSVCSVAVQTSPPPKTADTSSQTSPSPTSDAAAQTEAASSTVEETSPPVPALSKALPAAPSMPALIDLAEDSAVPDSTRPAVLPKPVSRTYQFIGPEVTPSLELLVRKIAAKPAPPPKRALLTQPAKAKRSPTKRVRTAPLKPGVGKARPKVLAVSAVKPPLDLSRAH